MRPFFHQWLIFLVPWTTLIVVAGAVRLLRFLKIFDDRLVVILGVSCLIYPLLGVPTTYLRMHYVSHDFTSVFVGITMLSSVKIATWIYDKRIANIVNPKANVA